MIAQVYAAAARHKGESSCTVMVPVVPGSITEAEKLGASPGFTTTADVPCIKGSRSRIRETSDSGARFVSTFRLLLHTDPSITITLSSKIVFVGKTYTLLDEDHDPDMSYWALRVKDE